MYQAITHSCRHAAAVPNSAIVHLHISVLPAAPEEAAWLKPRPLYIKQAINVFIQHQTIVLLLSQHNTATHKQIFMHLSGFKPVIPAFIAPKTVSALNNTRSHVSAVNITANLTLRSPARRASQDQTHTSLTLHADRQHQRSKWNVSPQTA
jgi:hypothetical protein